MHQINENQMDIHKNSLIFEKIPKKLKICSEYHHYEIVKIPYRFLVLKKCIQECKKLFFEFFCKTPCVIWYVYKTKHT